jgi:predicted Zn finger-like uncharacterized protein
MDLRCPQCQTLYEFDESKLDSGSATLKCRKCQHMFRLGDDAQPSREDERRWMVQDPEEGEILYFSAFDTLHRWIVEEEVDQNWELSRTGDTWTRLGDVGEFRPIFEAVDNVSSIEGESTISRSGDDEVSDGRDERNTLNQFHDVETDDSYAEEGPSAAAGDRSGSGEHADRARESSDVSVPDDSVSGQYPTGASTEDVPRHRTESPERGATSPAADHPADGGHSQGGGAPREAQSGGRTEGDPGGRAAPEAQEPEGSDVQLDSGRFDGRSSGRAEAQQAESDEWEFDEELDYGGDGVGWKTVLLVAVLLAAGGAGYLWMYEREMVRDWMATVSGSYGGGETTNEAESGADSSSVQAAASGARITMFEALGAATGAAETEANGISDAAHGKAREGIRSGIASGLENAEESAEEASGNGGGGGGGVIGLLSRANEELEGGNSRRAKQLFEQVLDREPGNSEALTGMGWAELSSGNAAAAKRNFGKALDVNPSFGDAYIGLGHANRDLGNAREALDAYKTYLENFPNGSKASIAEYQRDELQKQLDIN